MGAPGPSSLWVPCCPQQERGSLYLLCRQETADQKPFSDPDRGLPPPQIHRMGRKIRGTTTPHPLHPLAQRQVLRRPPEGIRADTPEAVTGILPPSSQIRKLRLGVGGTEEELRNRMF
ncbi:hypothetical protein LEMLEM_LOCUS25756 [Lemmus lemmus]